MCFRTTNKTDPELVSATRFSAKTTIFYGLVTLCLVLITGFTVFWQNPRQLDLLDDEFDARYRPFVSISFTGNFTKDNPNRTINLDIQYKNHGIVPALNVVPQAAELYVGNCTVLMNIIESVFSYESGVIYPDQAPTFTIGNQIPEECYEMIASGSTTLKFKTKLDYDGIANDKYWVSSEIVFDLETKEFATKRSEMGEY